MERCITMYKPSKYESSLGIVVSQSLTTGFSSDSSSISMGGAKLGPNERKHCKTCSPRPLPLSG